MEWKKFKDEKPINGQRILFSRKLHCGQYMQPNIQIIRNPFVNDKKYNPNYWFIAELYDKETEVTGDDIWCRITLPEKELL